MKFKGSEPLEFEWADELVEGCGLPKSVHFKAKVDWILLNLLLQSDGVNGFYVQTNDK